MGKSKSDMSTAEISWNNLCHYSTSQAKDVDKEVSDPVALMELFLESHPEGIRGHASGGKSSKKNRQTSDDITEFTEWFSNYKKEARSKRKKKK